MILVGASGNDPKNDFEIFLKNYAWVIAVTIVAIILVVAVIIVIHGRNNKVPTKQISQASSNEWQDALGGADNIIDIQATGSRLVAKIKNKELVNRDKLTELGVSSIVLMSDKITLVTNLDNQKIVDNMKNSQQKQGIF